MKLLAAGTAAAILLTASWLPSAASASPIATNQWYNVQF